MTFTRDLRFPGYVLRGAPTCRHVFLKADAVACGPTPAGPVLSMSSKCSGEKDKKGQDTHGAECSVCVAPGTRIDPYFCRPLMTRPLDFSRQVNASGLNSNADFVGAGLAHLDVARRASSDLVLA